jgi:molybdopterin molybdotransferase
MDGYALHGEIRPGDAFEISGTIAAGDQPEQILRENSAIRIMTGAPLPSGADRVVPIEDTSVHESIVTVHTSPAEGAHIRKRGEIIEIGDALLPTSSLLTPGALSVVATHGYQEVLVHGLPSVGVLATGNEVVSPNQVPKPGQLRDSHTDFLRAAVATLGLEITSLGIAPDDPERLREMALHGMNFDVFLICGGVSKGEFDFVEEILTDLGCDLLFDSVAMQPGKPLVAARHAGGLVFGLPGNPASVMVSFWLLVRPALRCLMGLQDGFWEGALRGSLTAPLIGASAKDRFVSAEVEFRNGEVLVTPVGSRGSHDLTAFGKGTALLRIPAHSEPSPMGASCEILPLADWRIGRS